MPRKRQPKLKTSCNECSSAKVRCDKAAPSEPNSPCLRCVQFNLECVYSVSQRKGKPVKPLDKTELPATVPPPVEEQQKNTDDQKSDYPWPKTGWNLSDVVAPSIDFSSVELEYSKIRDKDSYDPFESYDTAQDGDVGRHDMYSIAAYIGTYLAKADSLIDGTRDIMQHTDQLLTITTKVRNILNQALRCICPACNRRSTNLFSLATFSVNLVNIYAKIWDWFDRHAPELDSDQFMAVSLLLGETEALAEIASLIRKRAYDLQSVEEVGEAFYELLFTRAGYLYAKAKTALERKSFFSD